MKTLFQASLLFCSAATAVAQPQLLSLDWKNSSVLGGTAVTLDGTSVLKIENTSSVPLTVRLMTVSNPPVAKQIYAVTGQVKYENVQGDGYLEMWNYFPPTKPGRTEGRYFSRTLGDSGDMGKIRGTSGWRKFSLPFDGMGASGPPTRLEVNLVLPGSGKVYLRPMAVWEPAAGWWSARQGGWIGGIGGSVIGCSGALIGILASLGKARRFVLAVTKLFIVLGILLVLAGVLAVTHLQPYAVYYPLLLGGVICAAVFGANLRTVRKRYSDLEIRRMASIDAMGS
jgi:hypothetical protein